MSDFFWLSDAQMARLEPFFPKSHGKPRVDDRRVLSGIIAESERTQEQLVEQRKGLERQQAEL